MEEKIKGLKDYFEMKKICNAEFQNFKNEKGNIEETVTIEVTLEGFEALMWRVFIKEGLEDDEEREILKKQIFRDGFRLFMLGLAKERSKADWAKGLGLNIN